MESNASRLTKYKYLEGKQTYANKFFEKAQVPTTSIEGNMVCGNEKYIAVSTK
jgi:hypothetical protein